MVIDEIMLNKMFQVAIEAAKIAGKKAALAMDNIDVTIKNGNEIVTQMDPICQQIIIDHIRETFPLHGILGEEGDSGNVLREPPKDDSDIWWIIDPIDGTNNYAHKISNYTVSIAAMQHGLPIVGVIYSPATETLFSAVKGKCTEVNGKRVSASEEEIDRFAHISIDSRWPGGIPETIIKLLEKVKFRNLGTTALHLAYVSGGSLIASITNTTKLWDIAAGVLLVESAGGIVTDWKGKALFPVDVSSYSKEDSRLLAANATVHSQILDILKEL